MAEASLQELLVIRKGEDRKMAEKRPYRSNRPSDKSGKPHGNQPGNKPGGKTKHGNHPSKKRGKPNADPMYSGEKLAYPVEFCEDKEDEEDEEDDEEEKSEKERFLTQHNRR